MLADNHTITHAISSSSSTTTTPVNPNERDRPPMTGDFVKRAWKDFVKNVTVAFSNFNKSGSQNGNLETRKCVPDPKGSTASLFYKGFTYHPLGSGSVEFLRLTKFIFKLVFKIIFKNL